MCTLVFRNLKQLVVSKIWRTYISGSKVTAGVVVVVVVVVVEGVGSTTIASLGQQILGKLKPATFSSPHSQEPCIKLGKVGGIGLFKFSNNCKNGVHLL